MTEGPKKPKYKESAAICPTLTKNASELIVEVYWTLLDYADSKTCSETKSILMRQSACQNLLSKTDKKRS